VRHENEPRWKSWLILVLSSSLAPTNLYTRGYDSPNSRERVNDDRRAKRQHEWGKDDAAGEMKTRPAARPMAGPRTKMAGQTTTRRGQPQREQTDDVAGLTPNANSRTTARRAERRHGGSQHQREGPNDRAEGRTTTRTAQRQHEGPNHDTEGVNTNANDGGEGNPTPTCRETRRQRKPSANVSKDTEAEETQRQRVERHGGGGNPAPAC